jgi:hypothetical protein
MSETQNIEYKHVLHTKLSHNKKYIDDYLIKQMSSQCKLTKNEFMDLANCPFSEEEFVKILEIKGLLM